jgi:phosphoribosylglycinamide formyltransferase 1
VTRNVVIVTADAPRHRYFTSLIGGDAGINVLRAYVEGAGAGDQLVKKNAASQELEAIHYIARVNTEIDFFSDLILRADMAPCRYIQRGEVNHPDIIDEILSLKPDLIVTYGCSIIKAPLIDAMRDRIINVHLGLSPYYLGSGTNMHAMAAGEFEFCGYSLIYMDEGIDTGEIIHQEVGRLDYFDNPHTLGNRIIKDMSHKMLNLILNSDRIQKLSPVPGVAAKIFKKKDATKEVLERLYENFAPSRINHFVTSYRDKIPPLIQQEFLKDKQ